jgi:hypothetical protein
MAKDDVRSCTYNFGAVFRDQLGLPSHIRQTRLFGMAPTTAAFVRRMIEFGLEHSSERSVARYLREYGGSEPTGNVWEVAEANQFPDALIIAPLDHPGAGLRVVVFGKDDWKVYASEAPDRPMKLVE